MGGGLDGPLPQPSPLRARLRGQSPRSNADRLEPSSVLHLSPGLSAPAFELRPPLHEIASCLSSPRALALDEPSGSERGAAAGSALEEHAEPLLRNHGVLMLAKD